MSKLSLNYKVTEDVIAWSFAQIITVSVHRRVIL